VGALDDGTTPWDQVCSLRFYFGPGLQRLIQVKHKGVLVHLDCHEKKHAECHCWMPDEVGHIQPEIMRCRFDNKSCLSADYAAHREHIMQSWSH